MVLLLALLAFAGVVAAPFLVERRKPRIGRAAREAAPGAFARLPQGITHYRWFGPARGPVIVAIHGSAASAQDWEPFAAGLAALGYRVLAYDIWGRGWSDAVPGVQDAAMLLRQLDALLADQGLDENLTLLGHEMGGALATAYAAAQPERMKRLILVAPAGVTVTEDRLGRIMRRVPLVGDWLHLCLGARRLRAALPDDDPALPRLAGQLARQGFLASVLAARRGILSAGQEAAHRRIGHDDIPVVALWGDAGLQGPLRGPGQLAQWNRNARQDVVSGAGDAPHRSHAGATSAILREVLREV